jgi:NAD(P)-dependent dehydrogenase (short-subunit alcohol dehydrogenase family)
MERPVIKSSADRHFPDGVAVVIGGSGGLGQAVCGRLADHGTDVALSYRSNEAAARAAVEAIERAGRQAHAGRADLTDADGVARLFAEVAERFGRIHTVVTATGADISMVFVSEIMPEEWRRTIDGDLTGFYNVTRAALPLLRQGGGGSIVALTSAGLVRHPAKDILSTVPKAGIEAMIRGIAREEGRYGIRANAVALGVIDAGLFHRLEERVSKEFVEAMKRNTALRRFGTADEAADATVFLASSAAAYITGHSLTVDGGYSV